MAIHIHDNIISIEGHCPIEEAEHLFETLRMIDEPTFDLTQTKTMHTSIVQLVLASSGEVRGMPSDKVLAACFRNCSLG
jgi:hypothetical protein